MANNAPSFLYSTNVFMKFLIQERYRSGKHYVWCSEYFDLTKHGAYSGAYGIPPSSSPAKLYQRYKEDYENDDTHSSLIQGQKDGIVTRAAKWYTDGELSEQDLEDITFMVKNDRKLEWRPIIYIIRGDLVATRLKPVAASERAGVGMEYRIEDLARHEFDIIEV